MSPETTQQALVRLLSDAAASAEAGDLLGAIEQASAARMYWEDAGRLDDSEDETGTT